MIWAPGTSDRGGVSLVELLVVVAILGLLAVTVLPNIANTADSRRSRGAARMVSSFVSSAKSRAIGRREWAGFTLVAAAAGSSAAIDIFYADVPTLYAGDTTPALLTISGSSGSTRLASGSNGELATSGTGGANVRANDLIRFDGRGPWYELSHDATTGTSVQFRMRGDLSGIAKFNADSEGAGMRRATTPWPPMNTPISFEILRRPVLVGSALSLSDGRSIDLRWSGVGPPNVSTTVGTYRQFNASPVSIMFDGTGRLRQAVLPAQRWVITGAVFLLVGRADRAGQDPSALVSADDSVGANWQYADSFWVAIDPFSGVAKVAECVPNPGGATTYDQLIASQRWIREALASDGR
jgi:prepilin-type N-terminal cleavage/methylation domain-containing protein